MLFITSATEERIQRVFAGNERCHKIAAVEGGGTGYRDGDRGGRCRCRSVPQRRQLMAWLDLVPRQHSSGDKQRLPGITKRGDPYLRMLLIMEHARSFTAQARKQTAEVAGSQRNNENLGKRKRVWQWRTRTRGSSGPYWLKMSPTARQRRVLPFEIAGRTQ
jgi:hypothetical protein